MATAKRTVTKGEDVGKAAAEASAEVLAESEDSNRSVTGRPNDTPIVKPVHENSTFASRAKERNKRISSGHGKQADGD